MTRVVTVAIPVTIHASGAGFPAERFCICAVSTPIYGGKCWHWLIPWRTIRRVIHGAHVARQRVINTAKYLAASLTANGIALGQSGLKCGIQPPSKCTKPAVCVACRVTRLYAMYKNTFDVWQLRILCAGTSISLKVQNNPVHEEASAVLYS